MSSKLGCPSKDPDVSCDQKLLEKQVMIDQIEEEKRFSRAKRVSVLTIYLRKGDIQ